MKIRDITLLNFQAHKQLSLELDKGITTIVGDSDVGKSAVLRALRWTLLNDFAGEDFINEGASSAVALVGIRANKQNLAVERQRGDGNTYKIIAGESVEFASFGQGVPEEIAKILRVSELNFQSQHDAPFWFDLNGGELSKALNSVVDLSLIDESLANISKEVYRSKERMNLKEEDLQNSQRQIKALQNDQRITDFKALLKLNNQTVDAQTRHQTFSTLCAKIANNRAKEKQMRAEQAEEVLRLAVVWHANDKTTTNLYSLLVDIQHQEETVAPPNFKPVEIIYKKCDALKAQISDLNNLIDTLESKAVDMQAKSITANIREGEFHDKIKGKNCPLCQQRIQI